MSHLHCIAAVSRFHIVVVQHWIHFKSLWTCSKLPEVVTASVLKWVMGKC